MLALDMDVCRPTSFPSRASRGTHRSATIHPRLISQTRGEARNYTVSAPKLKFEYLNCTRKDSVLNFFPPVIILRAFHAIFHVLRGRELVY